MRLVVEPDLMERTVFEATRADASLAALYHREFSRCFDQCDADHRDAAFRALHERWFENLGFRDMILTVIDEFQHVRHRVARCVFTGQNKRRNDGAELFGRNGVFTAAALATPAMLLDQTEFKAWARHEFQHIDDMLDPEFGFDASMRPSGPTSAAANRLRERYAVLWSTSVDARLDARSLAHPLARERRHQEIRRCFGLATDAEADRALAQLWTRFQTVRPTHTELLAFSDSGIPGLSDSSGNATAHAEETAGAPCPLCSFPTYDWADLQQLPSDALDLICADSPDWTPRLGACGQCAELYRSRAGDNHRARRKPAASSIWPD